MNRRVKKKLLDVLNRQGIRCAIKSLSEQSEQDFCKNDLYLYLIWLNRNVQHLMSPLSINLLNIAERYVLDEATLDELTTAKNIQTSTKESKHNHSDCAAHSTILYITKLINNADDIILLIIAAIALNEFKEKGRRNDNFLLKMMTIEMFVRVVNGDAPWQIKGNLR